MSEIIGNRTAKIYQFPVGGRRSLVCGGEALKLATDVMQAQSAKVVHGGSWYHEEAIKEDALTVER